MVAFGDELDAAVGEVLNEAGDGVAAGYADGGISEADALDAAGEVCGEAGHVGYRGSGIGYRVSGIGYRVSGIGYRDIGVSKFEVR